MKDDGSYVPTADGGKQRLAAPPVESNEVSAFVLMDDIKEKLKLLNYESMFCDIYGFDPLEPAYFALPERNQQEQFYYFTSLVSWLMSSMGRDFTAPQQYDDPNASAATILMKLKEAGFPSDYPPNKLKLGNGDVVCNILNLLSDAALAHRKFAFLKPYHRPDDFGVQVEVDDGADEDLEDEVQEVVDESDEEEETVGANNIQETLPEVENKTDARVWRLEVERVAPKLRVTISGDNRDWAQHFSLISEHHKTIKNLLPSTSAQLKKMRDEISQTLEKISSREKNINNQLSTLGEEFSTASSNLAETSERYQSASKNVTQLTSELGRITDELDQVKNDMDDRSASVTDATPLVSIKQSLQKVKTELKQMDLRIGVLQQTLLSNKTRSKLSDAVAPIVSDEDDDSIYD